MFVSRSLLGVGLAVVLAVVGGSLYAVSHPAAAQPSASLSQPDSGQARQAGESVPVLEETVRLLSGQQLYQTYLNIGLLADLRAEGVYEAGELAQLLGSVVTPLERVDRQLEKVSALKGMGKEDVAALARMRRIADLLRTQGKSLQAHWDTGAGDHAARYEAARQAAWKELGDFLELAPDKAAAPEPKPVESNP